MYEVRFQIRKGTQVFSDINIYADVLNLNFVWELILAEIKKFREDRDRKESAKNYKGDKEELEVIE